MKFLTGNLIEQDLMKKFKDFLTSPHSIQGSFEVFRMNEGLMAAICKSNGSNFTYLFCEDSAWKLSRTTSAQIYGSLLIVVAPNADGLEPLECAKQYCHGAFVRIETWPSPELIGTV